MNKKKYIGICTLFLALLPAAITSRAATFIINNNANSGAGSLRQAIADAAPGDTINFAPAVTNVQLQSELVINKNLTIADYDANLVRLEMNTGNQQRVFRVTAGIVSLSGLSITGGNLEPSGTAQPGGSAFLISAGAAVTLNNSSVSQNQLFYEFSGLPDNGIIQNYGTLTITNTSIFGNNSNNSVGGIANHGTLTVTNSTISGNVVFVDSFGVGAIQNFSGTTTLLNCTIADNGGAGGNTGGVRRDAGSVNIKNTIIAGNFLNTGTMFSNDVSGSLDSQGNNLIGDTTGGTGFVAADLQNVNPQLGIFAHNGGAADTHSLLAGSPAIDAGNNTGAPATDQRGAARPQGAAVDIGAYESGVTIPAFGKIIYESTQDGNREIYSMNADFTNQTRLTNNSAEDRAPKWSPDGTKIVFQSRRDGNPEIYTMNANGSGQTRLTFNTPPDTLPDWSPDGSKIVFVKGSSYPSEIWTMDTTGANQTQISGGTLFGETEPAWSPDGSRIAFSASPTDGGTYELYVMNADGTNRIRLTNNFDTDSYPVWSPDGNSIAYLNDFNGRHAYLINPFNLNIRIIADINDPSETAPAWSPDGTKIAQYDSAGDIYFTNVGGSARFAAQAPEGIFVSPQSDWFGFNTPTGANVTAISGTTSVSFTSVSNSGTTTGLPINPATAGTLPGGYSLGAGFPAFEITTTAIYTAPITVCLQVPSVTSAMTFASLRILHNENGTLVDRTILSPDTPAPNFAAKTICARVNSLSPFVVASNAPTAAQVSVGGRVKFSNKRGVHLARVSLTDSSGAVRTTLTDFFGFYQFGDVPAGETYIVSVAHRRYQFADNPRVVTILEQIGELDFAALSFLPD